ncbi:MAG TPA: hypothetical protein VD837_11310 [Terriglobales bacterium]|nr:hypothetical protein [Terriglobales bacterium]
MINRLVVTAVLLSSFGLAQQPATTPSPFGLDPSAASANVTEQRVPVSKSDIYCAGYISKQTVNRENFVAGGLQSPHTTRFVDRDIVFLRGSGYQPGTLVSIVREWKNPDRFDLYKGASKLLKETGQPYQDIAYARVIELRGTDTAVAQMEFGCESVVPGDLVVPFVERSSVTVRQSTTLDRFPGEKPSVEGKIVLARDGDQLITTGRKVYLNVGLDKGVKVGDYLRVTRGYTPDETDEADAATLKSTVMDDTQKNAPKFPNNKLKELPRRVLGEVVVIGATPDSSTAMVTFMLEEMHVGDAVELEAPQQEPQTPGTH